MIKENIYLDKEIIKRIEKEIEKTDAFYDKAYQYSTDKSFANYKLIRLDIDDDGENHYKLLVAKEGVLVEQVLEQYLKINELKKQYPDYFDEATVRFWGTQDHCEEYVTARKFSFYTNLWSSSCYDTYLTLNETKEELLARPDILKIIKENDLDILFEDYTRLSDGKKMKYDYSAEWGSADDAYYKEDCYLIVDED